MSATPHKQMEDGLAELPGQVPEQRGQVQLHRQLAQRERTHVAARHAQHRQQPLLAGGLPVKPARALAPDPV